MNRMRILVACMLLLVWQGAAGANDARVNSGHSEKRRVEAIVAEFLDPGATGLGQSLSYLIWHELHTAIGSQTGTDVILLPIPKELGNRLEEGRHQAAVEIAQAHQAPMILWGEVQVREQGSQTRVLVNTFLTLNQNLRDRDLSFRLVVGQGAQARSFRAELPRPRFNFVRLAMRRPELFARWLVTRQGATLHAAPNDTAPVVAQVPAGTALEAMDMQDTWFAVRRPEVSIAYVDRHQVQVLPRRVEVAHRHVNLRQGPGGEYESKQSVDLQGTFEVRDMRYRFGQGLWYHLQAEGTDGWVTGSLARPRFLLPVEHFMAGLSYYWAQRFEDAYLEFSRFIQTPGVEESNVNLATAYQLQGASSLMFKDPFSFGTTADLQVFSTAITLTPFDPAAYYFRALARFGVSPQLDGVLADLKQALDLNPLNPQVWAIVRTLVDAATAVFQLPPLDWLQTVSSIERIRQGPHTLMPPNASKIGPGASGADVVMTVENHTGSTLHLHFVGSVIRTVEVPTGKTKDVDLAAGTYAIAAEFPQELRGEASPIRRIYGEQTYEPQTHYVLKFYVQWRRGS